MTSLYRAEAAAALAHIDALGRRMERLLRENEDLRAENTRLRQRQSSESSELGAHQDELVA
jgi:regulator of replication initiation timing